MTIEQKINKILRYLFFEKMQPPSSIQECVWLGTPYLFADMPDDFILKCVKERNKWYYPIKAFYYKIRRIKTLEERIYGVNKNILKLIKKADAIECLTSQSEYIRECKNWYMEKK